MDKIVVWIFIFFMLIGSIADTYELQQVKQRLTKLEQQPKLELTCSIPDNKKRYVCRYVEIAR